MSAGFNIEQIKALIADREAFQAGFSAASGLYAATRAFPYKIVGSTVRQYDMSLHVNPNLPVEVIGDTYDTSHYAKGWKNVRDLKLMAYPLKVSYADYCDAESRGISINSIVDQNVSGWADMATIMLADAIRGGYGDSARTSVYANVDEASTTNLFFATDHKLGGTEDSNWRTATPILTGTSIADAHTYLGDAIEEWENLPNFRGVNGGMGNDFFRNGMILCSSDISSTIRTLQKARTINSGDANIYHESFRYEVIPELEAGTLVITRDPQKDGRVSGFHMILGDSIGAKIHEPMETAGDLSLTITDARYLGALPTVWTTSLLLKAA